MSYQQKIKTMEAGPWSVASGKKFATFHIPASGSCELANSYLEFSGTISVPICTYADGYQGQLTFGYVNATETYEYSSGPAVFVRNCWLECEKLGKVESKRYANIINEQLAHLSKSDADVRSQDYSGGLNLSVVNNAWVARLQLSDLLELAKDEPLIDLEYMGNTTLTLELETGNANMIFLKYIALPFENVVAPAIPVAPSANITSFTLAPGTTAQSSTLHLNQVYEFSYNSGGAKTDQHVLTSIVDAGGVCTVTFTPAMVNANGAAISAITIQAPATFNPLASNTQTFAISEVDLVLYKPFQKIKQDKLTFREWLVDTDNQGTVQNYHKQFNLEPNVQMAKYVGVKDNQLVPIVTSIDHYRNQINGYDTVDRDIPLQSGLYFDRIIMNNPNVRKLNMIDRYDMTELIPMNGESNTLGINLYHTGALAANRTGYLFKHQLKQM